MGKISENFFSFALTKPNRNSLLGVSLLAMDLSINLEKQNNKTKKLLCLRQIEKKKKKFGVFICDQGK